MTGRRRGSLGPEDRDLWDKVAATARPLDPRKVAPKPKGATVSEPSPKPPSTHAARIPTDVGSAKTPLPARSTANSAHPIQMDAKAHRRMVRGKTRPEARIDLHGMTLAVAHAALTGFILRSHAQGLRLALVITGKGGRTDALGDGRRGALNRQVPHWLRMTPLSAVVLQVSVAHRTHGGDGALYVYLRRRG